MTTTSRLVVAAALAAATMGPALIAPAPAAAQSAEDEEGTLLVKEARRAIAKRDYQRAGGLLDRALAVNPRRIDVYVLRASVHGVQQEHDRAIEVLRTAQRLAPDSGDVLAALGVQLILAGKADEGLPIVEKVVAREPRRYDAQVVLGHLYVRQARWADAVVAFNAYFAARPGEVAGEDPIHEVDQANAYLRSGDPAAARKLYRKVLSKSPKSEMARLGVAWSAAAIDCREAMPVFDGLGDLEAKYAEVSLVRGRCAWLLGRLDDALASAERYRKAKPEAGDGWGLLGDVRSAKKDHAAAETAYGRALSVEPESKLYAFKLGRTERLLGKTKAAVDRLRKSGPPRDFEADWTLEVAESLHTLEQPAEVKAHLTPWMAGNPTSAQGQFLLGSALLQLGDLDGAVDRLEKASAGGEVRAKRPLIRSLNAIAVAEIGRQDLAGAEAVLVRASNVDDDVITWRNLGAVYLARNDIDKATLVLRKAVEKDRKDPVANHLLARAYHGAKKFDDARGAYARAIQGYGKDKRAAAAQLDLANAELAAGRGEQAVSALEAALDGTDAETRGSMGKALVDAARAVATDAMRGSRFTVAVRVLRQIEKRITDPAAVIQVRCDLALAATGSGQRELALDYLRKLDNAKVRCPFVAPADELAVPILIAWNEGAGLRKARKALTRLDALRKKASGVAEPLVRIAAKDLAIRAAAEAYAGGNARQAAQFLNDAKGYDRRSPELIHNLAVVDLASGKIDAAIAQLDQVKNEVPEALINLGIAYDRRGDAQRALDYWRRAAATGVRFGPLNDWIESKERFWGGSR